MTPEQFCYWLQGFAEVVAPDVPTEKQWVIIRDHLSTVFEKVTPKYTPDSIGPTVPYYLGRDLNPGKLTITC